MYSFKLSTFQIIMLPILLGLVFQTTYILTRIQSLQDITRHYNNEKKLQEHNNNTHNAILKYIEADTNSTIILKNYIDYLFKKIEDN